MKTEEKIYYLLGEKITRRPNYVDAYQHYEYTTMGKKFPSLEKAKQYIRDNVTETNFGKKSCDTCLFYVDTMPDVIICIGGKHIKEYDEMKTNCKKWVENTQKNAKEQLELIKKRKGK